MIMKAAGLKKSAVPETVARETEACEEGATWNIDFSLVSPSSQSRVIVRLFIGRSVGEGEHMSLGRTSFFTITPPRAGTTRRILWRGSGRYYRPTMDDKALQSDRNRVLSTSDGSPDSYRIQRPFPVVAHGEVLEIAEMVGMVP